MADPTLPRPTRRRFLTAAGGLAASAAGVAGYTLRIEPHWVKVERVDMPLAGLPADLDGKTLAQVSDLHVGPQVDAGYLTAALGRLSALSPDLVAITGDFMTCHGTEQVDATAEVLAHLSRPPLGCFAALGNHDYGQAWSKAVVAGALSRRLADLGVTVLKNARRDVAGLQVIGVDDLWGGRFDPSAAVAGLRPGAPAVALCHNPDGVDRAGWGRFRGWVVAGHTHGGQCKPPLLPPPFLPVANRRYVSGAYALGGGRTLYVNPGLGHIVRARFNARPEITLFRLCRA